MPALSERRAPWPRSATSGRFVKWGPPEPLSDEQVQELRLTIADIEFTQTWRRPREPHQYFTIWSARDPYEQLASAIRRHGTLREFKGVSYRNLHLDGWRYWIAFPVINRAMWPAPPVRELTFLEEFVRGR